MRAISRTASVAATAVVLAVTAALPTVAEPRGDAKRPLVGSEAAAKEGRAPSSPSSRATESW